MRAFEFHYKRKGSKFNLLQTDDQLYLLWKYHSKAEAMILKLFVIEKQLYIERPNVNLEKIDRINIDRFGLFEQVIQFLDHGIRHTSSGIEINPTQLLTHEDQKVRALVKELLEQCEINQEND